MGECRDIHETYTVGWMQVTYCVACRTWHWSLTIRSLSTEATERAAGRIPDDEYQDRNQERLVRRFLGTIRSVEEEAHADQLVLELDWD